MPPAYDFLCAIFCLLQESLAPKRAEEKRKRSAEASQKLKRRKEGPQH
jgi:hypothetical protein